jgi:hypothetical protein
LNKIGKFIWWATQQAAVAAMLWFGVVKGVEGAANCALVLFWFMNISALFSMSDEVVESLRKRGRTVPEQLDFAWDLAVAGTLVWNGWTWTGVFFLIAMSCVQAAWSKAEKRGFAA